MLILRRLDDRLSKRLRRLASYDIVNAPDKSPPLPSRKQSGQRVSQAMLECRYHDAPSTARHTLHVPQYEWRGNRVRLTSTAASDNHRDIGSDELSEPLRLIKIDLVHSNEKNEEMKE